MGNCSFATEPEEIHEHSWGSPWETPGNLHEDRTIKLPVSGKDSKKFMELGWDPKGYSFEPIPEYVEKTRKAKKRITAIGNFSRFKSGERLEKICAEVEDINRELKISNIKDSASAFNSFRMPHIGDNKVILDEESKLYLFDHGFGIYFGNKESLPTIKDIPIANGASPDFSQCLLDAENGVRMKEWKCGTPKEKAIAKGFDMIYNGRMYGWDRDFYNSAIDAEFSFLNEPRVREDDGIRHSGQNFFVYGEYVPINYDNATDFHTVQNIFEDVNIEIAKDYEHDWGRSHVRKRLYDVMGDLKDSRYHDHRIFTFLDGSFYIPEMDMDDNVHNQIYESTRTPYITNIHGDINIISHSPEVKFNGIEHPIGRAPKNPRYEIDCKNVHGGINVVYDY